MNRHRTVQELFFDCSVLLSGFRPLFLDVTAEDVGAFGRSLRLILRILNTLVID